MAYKSEISWSRSKGCALGTLGLVLLWAGCARFQSQSLSSPNRADLFEARSLTNDALRAFFQTNGLAGEWPRTAWDIRALTLTAFYYHPELDVARAKWAVATAGKITAA